jgi:hypothetical protein
VRAAAFTAALLIGSPAFADEIVYARDKLLMPGTEVLKPEYRQCGQDSHCTYIKAICGWEDMAVNQSLMQSVTKVLWQAIEEKMDNKECETPLGKRPQVTVNCIDHLCVLRK